MTAVELIAAVAQLLVCAAFTAGFLFELRRTRDLKGPARSRRRLIAGSLLVLPLFVPNFGSWLVVAIKSVHAAVVFGVVWLAHTRDDPVRLVVKWVISLVVIIGGGGAVVGLMRAGDAALFAPPVAAGLAVILSVIWVPNLIGALARPLTGVFEGDDEPDDKPCYSQAQAAKMRGRYEQAIELAQAQLGQFPGDFEGQMFIATVQAENCNDLAAGTAAIEEILAQPDHAPHQRSYALNTLADWQLKTGDAASAKATLERLVAMFPGTELEQQTIQRLSRMVTAAPRAKREAVVMPEFERDLGLRGMKLAIKPPGEETPDQKAALCIERLKAYPADWSAREELALLYAEHYQRVDLAVGQFEQLIAQPNQPQKQVVHWLHRIAELHVRFGNDRAAARAAHERIATLFPGTAAATRALEAMTALADAPAPPKVTAGATAEEFIDYAARAGLRRKDDATEASAQRRAS
jgi:tetratricopeptide (TPR) repeat protein